MFVDPWGLVSNADINRIATTYHRNRKLAKSSQEAMFNKYGFRVISYEIDDRIENTFPEDFNFK